MPRGNPSPKLAITVDPDVYKRIRSSAAEEGVSVSAWMTEAARNRLIIHDGLQAMREYEEEFGAFTEEELAAADERIRHQEQPRRGVKRSA